ncbi:spore germination protein GerPC [Jeotgalibacillus soli]|uniref:Spore germination protein GerPC n=1 Tax=Jeotgalibacillus soli TaxID=889306 RepID=A0A0C2R5W0_9BACL|nr:spore germination protein GerPC [Jeotgalibacillus soli]KIL45645.1 hypothetical protein KP78_19940 [Jeotgalibacillus soli]
MFVIQQLYYQLSVLQQQLADCTKRLQEIEQKLQGQSASTPPIHIEKIEYNFDQLKIETLEGTLSIGLSPSDLSNHENVEIPGWPIKSVQQDQLISHARNYLTEQIPIVFSEHSQIVDPNGSPLSEDVLINQLMNQLPGRIEHLKANHEGQTPPSDELLKALIERDLSHALQSLHAQQPNVKGE